MMIGTTVSPTFRSSTASSTRVFGVQTLAYLQVAIALETILATPALTCMKLIELTDVANRRKRHQEATERLGDFRQCRSMFYAARLRPAAFRAPRRLHCALLPPRAGSFGARHTA